MGIFDDIKSGKLSTTETIDPDTGLTKKEAAIDKVREAEETGVSDISTGRALSMDLTGRRSTDFVDKKLWNDAVKGGQKVWGPGGSGVYIGDDYTDYAAAGQSTADKWANGGMKLVGKSVINTVGGVGMIGTAIGALFPRKEEDGYEWNFRNIYENEFHNSLDDINAWMDYKLPNYVAKEERENNFFQSMGTANFWAGDLFGQAVPFVIGAVLTEAALTFATGASGFAAAPAQGAATVSLLARATSLLTKLARVSSVVGKGAKGTAVLGKFAGMSQMGAKFAKGGKLARQILTGAGYESGVEARHHINTLRSEFTADFHEENGRAPNARERAEIHDTATRSANWVFAGNLALVGGGNMLQFPKIFGPGARSLGKKPLGKILRDSYLDPYRAAYKSWNTSRNIMDAGYHALKNPVWEGIIEEGGQGWIDNAAHHNAAKYWARKHNASGIEYGLGMIGALGDTFAESYGSKEAWKEIGMGMLIGGMGLPTYARTGAKTEGGKDVRKFEMQGGMFEPLRGRKEKRARTDALVDAINKNPSAVTSLRNKFENYSRAVDLQMEKDNSLAENDMFTYKNAENDEFFSFISSRLEAGLYNDVIADINLIEDMSNEEFVKEFGYTDIAARENWSDDQISARKKKVVESALAQAQKVKESTDLVDSKFEGIGGWSQEEINKAYTQFAHHLPADQQTVENLNKVIREQLIHSASTIESVDRRHDEVSARLDEITGGVLREEGATDLATQMRKSSMQTFGARARVIQKKLSENEKLPDDHADKLSEAEVIELNQYLGYLKANIAAGLQDNAVDDAEVMEAFAKNNPKEFVKEDVQKEVLGLLRDLRKLNARRQEFVGYYNGLFTKEGQQEALTQVEFFMDEEASKAREAQKEEALNALREGNDKAFRDITDGLEFEVRGTDADGNQKKGYYTWVPDSGTVLYNVKDSTDQITIDDIRNFDENGAPNYKEGVQLLTSLQSEQRRVIEAIERIRETSTEKIAKTQERVAELNQEIEDMHASLEFTQQLWEGRAKYGKIWTPKDAVYKSGPNKGKPIPRRGMKHVEVLDILKATNDVLTELKEEHAKLSEDLKLLTDNRTIFNSMLKEMQSPGSSWMLTLNQRAAFEQALGEEGLAALGVNRALETLSSTTAWLTPPVSERKYTSLFNNKLTEERQLAQQEASLLNNADGSVALTETMLTEVADMISMLQGDIENLTQTNEVIKEMILEDSLGRLISEFKKAYPQVHPTYSDVTRFLNEHREDFEFFYGAEFSEEMFTKAGEIEAARRERDMMLDEFYANAELIEKMGDTLQRAKQKEAALVDLWDRQLKGVEKVQKALQFGKAYTVLQDLLGAIYMEEQAQEDALSEIGISVDVVPNTSEAELVQKGEDPDVSPLDEGPKKKFRTKSNLVTAGWWHSTGLDRDEKHITNQGVNPDGTPDTDYMTIDQRRWFWATSNLSVKQSRTLRLLAVTPETVPDELKKELEDHFLAEAGNDAILLVLANEDGTPYRKTELVDGEEVDHLVFTHLTALDPKGENVYIPPTYKGKARAKLLADKHAQFVAFRESIKAADKGGVILPIKGLSKGTRVYQKSENGKDLAFESVVGRLTSTGEKGLKEVKDIELWVASPSSNTNVDEKGNYYINPSGMDMPYKVKSGQVYAKYKGRLIDMTRRDLNEKEIDLIISILRDWGTKGEDVIKGTDIKVTDYLMDMLNFGRPKKGTKPSRSTIYTTTQDGTTYLVFGNTKIDILSLELSATKTSEKFDPVTKNKTIETKQIGSQVAIDTLADWLSTMWHSVRKNKLGKPYQEVRMDTKGVYEVVSHNSYEEYLMSPRDIFSETPLGTPLVLKSENLSFTQFRGTNILLKPGGSISSPGDAAKRTEAKNDKDIVHVGKGEHTDMSSFQERVGDITGKPVSKPEDVPKETDIVDLPEMKVGEEYTLVIHPIEGTKEIATVTKTESGQLSILTANPSAAVSKLVKFLNQEKEDSGSIQTIMGALIGPHYKELGIHSGKPKKVVSGKVEPQGQTLADVISEKTTSTQPTSEVSVLDAKTVQLSDTIETVLIPVEKQTGPSLIDNYIKDNGFTLKDEEHITVIGYGLKSAIDKKLAQMSDNKAKQVKEKINKKLQAAANKVGSIKYTRPSEYYEVSKVYPAAKWTDAEGVAHSKPAETRHSIIQKVDSRDIVEIDKIIKEELGLDIDQPFIHITVATKGNPAGIGITSESDFNSLNPKLIDVATQPTSEAQVKVSDGVEISSNTKGLAGALTNPTELSKKKGNIKQSYPVKFAGSKWTDAEAVYQALKSDFTKDNGPRSTYNLMVAILIAKLTQYPELVEGIRKEGGVLWIVDSTHQPTTQNSVWETGGKDWFIKALAEAYAQVASEQTQPVQVSKESIDNFFNSLGAVEHPPVEGEDVKDLNVSVVNDLFPATKEERAAEIKWFKNTYPGLDITTAKGLIDGVAFGRTINASRVIISDMSIPGTTYHEGFHITMGRFTTPETREEIYKAFTRLTGIKDAVEEKLSEEFRYWKLANGNYTIGKGSKKDQSILQRFFQAILDIVNYLMGKGPAKDRARLNEFFQMIDSTVFVQAVPGAHPIAMLQDKRISIEGTDELFSVPNSKDITESIIGHMFDDLEVTNSLSIDELMQLSSVDSSDAIAKKIKGAIDNAWARYFQEAKLRVNALFAPGGMYADLSAEEKAKKFAEVRKQVKQILQSSDNVNHSVMEWLSQFDVVAEIETPDEFKKMKDQYNIKENNEINVRETAPKMIKLLMASLPAGRSKGTNTVYGKSLVDNRPFFNFIQRELNGIAALDIQVTRLRELRASDPLYGGQGGPIDVLIRRLGVDNTADEATKGEIRLQTQFRQQFHKFVTSDILILQDEFGLRIIPAGAERKAALAIAKFRANLQDMNNKNLSIFDVKEDGAAYLNLTKKLDIQGANINLKEYTKHSSQYTVFHTLDVLEYFGINFPNRGALSDEELRTIKEEADVIFDVVISRRNVPMDHFFSKASGAYNRLQTIAAIQSKQSPETIDFGLQSPTGKPIYGVITNTFTTNIVGLLNNGILPSYFMRNGEVKESLKGSILIDAALEGEVIGVGPLLGISIEGTKIGSDLQDVSPNKLVATEILTTLSGIVPIARASDAKTEFTLNLTARKNGSKKVFDRIPKDERSYLNQTKVYLRQELIMIKSEAGNNISVYRDAKKGLMAFGYMTEGSGAIPLGDLAEMTPDEFIATHNDAIEAKILEDLRYKRAAVMPLAVSAGVLDLVDVKEKTYRVNLPEEVLAEMGITFEEDSSTISEVLANKIIDRFNMIYSTVLHEQNILLFGSVGFHKPGAYFKRTKGISNPKEFASVGEHIDAQLASVITRKDKKQPNSKMNIIVNRDVMSSVSKERFLDIISNRGISDKAMNVLSEYLDTPREALGEETLEQRLISNKVSEADIITLKVFESFLSFTEPDALGVMSFDEYMEALMRVGHNTPAQDAAYARYLNGEKLSVEEVAIFNPQKFQYYGPVHNSEIYSPMMLKLAVLPLIPGTATALSQNSAMAQLEKDMINRQVGLMVFESGVKIGKHVDHEGNANEFYNEEGVYSELNPGHIQEIDYEFFGVQVKIDDKLHTKTPRGSQQRVLKWANVMENGEIINEELHALNIEADALEVETVNAQYAQLIRHLGITKDTNGDFHITDEGALQLASILEDEAVRRNMSDSYIDGLQEFASSKIQVLDMLGNKPRVEALLFSLVSNRVVGYKTKGSAKVQVPTTGFEPGARTSTDIPVAYQDKHKYGANFRALHSYRPGEGGYPTGAMEIVLPHSFKELLGADVSVINGEVWADGQRVGSAELLEVYGYRVPTTALNSMDAFIIVGFLPPEAGDTIMVPAEIVVKTGSDFDIDKLTLFLHNYIYNKATNSLKKVQYLTNANSTMSERITQLRKLDIAKYRELHSKHGDLAGVDTDLLALEKELRGLRKEFFKKLNTPEALDIRARIETLYSKVKKKGITKKVKDALYLDIGILQAQLLGMGNMIEIDEQLGDDSIEVQIVTIGEELEGAISHYDMVLATNLDKAIKNGTIFNDAELNAQKAIDNRIIDLSRAVVLHPDNYTQLMRPVGVTRIKHYADEIVRLKGTDTDKIPRHRLQDFSNIIKVSRDFWGGKNALSIGAVANIHQVKAQRSGLAIKVPSSFKIPFPHAPFIKEDGFKYMPIGNRFDANPNKNERHLISEVIGELTNAFMDVSEDPFASRTLNMNPITAGMGIGMFRMGIPLKYVSAFLSQEVLIEYVNLKLEKTKKIEDRLTSKYKRRGEELIKFLPKTFEYIPGEKLLQLSNMKKGLKVSSIFSLYDTARAQGMDVKEALAHANNLAGTAVDIQTLARYIHLQQGVLGTYFSMQDAVVDHMDGVSQAVVGDRDKGSPRSRAHAKLIVRRLQKLFESDKYRNLDKYVDGGMQGGFESILEQSSRMYGDVFLTDIVPQAAEVIDPLTDAVLEDKYLKFEEKIKFVDLVEHNFISYIITTVGSEGSMSMTSSTERLFQGDSTRESLPERMHALKKEVGNRFMILNELFPILNPGVAQKDAINNIKRFTKRLENYDRNLLIESMDDFMNSYPSLANDLISFILLQSGTMTSPISWLDLIPANQYSRVVYPILERYIESGEHINVSAFPLQFKKNNHSNSWVVSQMKKYVNTAEHGDAPSSIGRDEVIIKEKDGKVIAEKSLSPRGRPEEISIWTKNSISKELQAEVSRRYGAKLSVKQVRKKLKEEGKSVGSFKFFRMSEVSKANQILFMQFAKDRDKAISQYNEAIESGKEVDIPTFKNVADKEVRYSINAKFGLFDDFKKLIGGKVRITWYQDTTLGDGQFLKEYGPPGHTSILKKNNLMENGIEATGLDFNDIEYEAVADIPVTSGDILNMKGVPVIPVSKTGTQTGLAAHAHHKGLRIFTRNNPNSKATSVVVSDAVGDVVDPTTPQWNSALRTISIIADRMLGKSKILVPPIGMLVGSDVATNRVTQERFTAIAEDLLALTDKHPNVQIVIPSLEDVLATGNIHSDALKKQVEEHLLVLNSLFKCK